MVWSAAIMMTTFTDWDILRNLLLAARWTLLLSLVAFVGGTLVTLPLLFMRLLQRKWLTRLVRGYTALFQGTPLLMQLFLVFFGVAGADLLHQRLSGRYLVRQHPRPAKRPVGSVALSRPDLWSDAVAGHCAAGDPHRYRADGGVCCPGDQGHRAGVNYRVHRADQGGHHSEQRDLSAV
jgi:His/Glu/Gln/Arg/opine family amino acid ABC transporter permease subunit